MTAKIEVQDNNREERLIKLFDLRPGDGNRIGVDAYDALGNEFELKTTSKGSVSTARDLGPAHIDKWEKRFWIIATFKNRPGGRADFERFFFFSREHLSGWYEKIRADFKKDVTLREKVEEAVGDNLTEEEGARMRYLFKRGMCKNDPNIPWGYVQKHGIEITSNHAETLRNLVSAHPIDMPADDSMFSFNRTSPIT